MSDPISSVAYRDISWIEQPSDREDFRETLAQRNDERVYGPCAEPKSVVNAVLCGDELAVSNACRRAKPGTIDDLLCDDPAFQTAQNFFADIASKAAQLVLGAKMGRSK
jgi:hypothetical protein